MDLYKPRFKCALIIVTINLIAISVSAQKASFIQSLDHQNRWVDSVFRKMNRRKKIAQLFFIRANTNMGQAYEDSVANVIADEQVGGLVFFQGGPVRQANLTNRYQKLVKVPLLIAMDGEWGIGMRLDSTISYPYQMTLGAVHDNSLIYKMGQQVAYDFERMGMQMNLGPDMDINNNPDNPVINFLREFLSAGPRLMKDAEEAALGRGHSPKQLRTARETIGVAVYREQPTGPWWWKLLDGNDVPF